MYYDDCAYIEIEYSPIGQFTGEQLSEPLLINFPQTTGIGPQNGLHAKDDGSYSANRISPECGALENNFFGLAGTSTNPQNLDGWATVAANLAPYLGNYVKINFILFHADAPGNLAQQDTPGWYIDDVTIGETYVSDGTMVIENLQAPQNYEEKSPNGYGLLFLDAFEPANSELRYTIRDAVTGQIATDGNGNQFQDLTGPVIELWDLDATNYPYIDIEVNFDSGSEQISSPIFYGYSFGTEMGITFNDKAELRDISVVDGEFNYVHDKGFDIYMNSSMFLPQTGGDFSKPIYSINVTGANDCQVDIALSSMSYDNPVVILQEVENILPSPTFDFSLKITLTEDCTFTNLWVSLNFAHHMNDIEVDFGIDQTNEWEFSDPGFGYFGFQNMFYSGEQNSVSQGIETAKLTLDTVTGSATDGFFLIPKDATIEYFDVSFSNNEIFDANNTNFGFDLALVVGATSYPISDQRMKITSIYSILLVSRVKQCNYFKTSSQVKTFR